MMSLLRYDPFRELDRLSRQFLAPVRPSWSLLPMDAWREGDRLVARFDLPGVDPESIDVSVDRNVLTVKAERSWSPAASDEVSVQERFQGRFSRRLALSENLEIDKVEARYDAGVLTLWIPVAEKARARKVTVSVGSGAETKPMEAPGKPATDAA